MRCSALERLSVVPMRHHTSSSSSGAARNVTDQTFEIDDGVALENLRQARSGCTRAAARALVEFEVKMQFAIVAFLGSTTRRIS